MNEIQIFIGENQLFINSNGKYINVITLGVDALLLSPCSLLLLNFLTRLGNMSMVVVEWRSVGCGA
jgi:hypothetical protein